MKLRSLIKHNGKRCLYNNWGKAMAIVLLQLSVGLFFCLLELLMDLLLPQGKSSLRLLLLFLLTLALFLLQTPLRLGTFCWYYDLTEGQSPEVLSIFRCFSSWQNLLKVLWLRMRVWSASLTLGLLYGLLPAAVGAGAVACIRLGPGLLPGDWSAVLGAAGLLLAGLLALFFGACWASEIQRYFLAPYYLLSLGCGVEDALRKARHASRGHRWEILAFRLSFLPWKVAGLLLLPQLYGEPYYQMSAVLYSRVLMEGESRVTQMIPLSSKRHRRWRRKKPVTGSAEATQIFEPQNPPEEKPGV